MMSTLAPRAFQLDSLSLFGMAVPDDTPTAEDSMAAQQELELLRQAIAPLSPLCQRIFELNRLQGLTHAEVARRLKIRHFSPFLTVLF